MQQYKHIYRWAICGALVLLLFFVPVFARAAVSTETKAYLKSLAPTAWTLLAQIASGEKIDPTNLDAFLLSDSLTEASKSALVVASVGADRRSSFVMKLVDTIKNKRQSGQLGDPSLLNDDFWGILGLKALGLPNDDLIVEEARTFVLKNQRADGGWGWGVGPAVVSDTNDTAAAIMALLESGSSRDPITKAIAYLKTQQNDDGGFSYDHAQYAESDAASDAWVIMALRKAGENPEGWKKSGQDPLAHLRSLQLPDGSFRWKKGDAQGSARETAYAAVALADQSYPLRVSASLLASLPAAFLPAPPPPPSLVPISSAPPVPSSPSSSPPPPSSVATPFSPVTPLIFGGSFIPTTITPSVFSEQYLIKSPEPSKQSPKPQTVIKKKEKPKPVVKKKPTKKKQVLKRPILKSYKAKAASLKKPSSKGTKKTK